MYSYGVIPLTRGLFAIIDTEDIEELNKYTWHATNKGYAARRLRVNEGRGIELMHRRLLCLSGKIQGDHINRDKLDNRKSNLRTASNGENQINQPPDKTNKTGYKGVAKLRNRRGYIAQAYINNEYMYLGYFLDKHAAAEAYNNAVQAYYGERAYLNVIERGE